jgi:hypothetical protein
MEVDVNALPTGYKTHARRVKYYFHRPRRSCVEGEEGLSCLLTIHDDLYLHSCMHYDRLLF